MSIFDWESVIHHSPECTAVTGLCPERRQVFSLPVKIWQLIFLIKDSSLYFPYALFFNIFEKRCRIALCSILVFNICSISSIFTLFLFICMLQLSKFFKEASIFPISYLFLTEQSNIFSKNEENICTTFCWCFTVLIDLCHSLP